MAVKVLIVDDQTAFRSAAREVVAATAGFEVVGEASSGEESVAAATRLHPDLVLMDVRLPGVDGLEASRLIRSEHDEITVFLLSTYDEEEFASRISGSRAAAFIPKFAFSSDSLVSAWDAVIDRTDSSQTRVQKDHT
jgi:DNA-binding NarL/FixJ family response regulator